MARGRIFILAILGIVGLAVASEVIKLLTADTTNIEVASVNIPVGTKITASMFQSKLVHNDGLEPGVITVKTARNLVGEYSTQSIQMGQQLTSSNVNTGTGSSGIEAEIPKGDVGVNIPVTATTGFSADLSTKDTVDLLGSVSTGSGQNQNIISNFIAENVPVLGLQYDPNNKSAVVGVQVAVKPAVAAQIEELLATGNGTNNGQVRIVVPGYVNRGMSVGKVATDLPSLVNALKK